MTTIYLVRHGEVYNPDGIIYGRLPGFGLSAKGRAQLERAAQLLAPCAPFQALYASPMQRAQESAAILETGLGLESVVEERLLETEISAYQGKPFSALPSPYLTETPEHTGIESAASIRARLLDWTAEMENRHPGARIVAVSHRDPIIVILLHWLGRGLADLAAFPLAPGGVHEVVLQPTGVQVRVLG
jgi:broad specificity phosphatase PhoE